jgi:hypothetical protein
LKIAIESLQEQRETEIPLSGAEQATLFEIETRQLSPGQHCTSVRPRALRPSGKHGALYFEIFARRFDPYDVATPDRAGELTPAFDPIDPGNEDGRRQALASKRGVEELNPTRPGIADHDESSARCTSVTIFNSRHGGPFTR